MPPEPTDSARRRDAARGPMIAGPAVLTTLLALLSRGWTAAVSARAGKHLAAGASHCDAELELRRVQRRWLRVRQDAPAVVMIRDELPHLGHLRGRPSQASCPEGTAGMCVASQGGPEEMTDVGGWPERVVASLLVLLALSAVVLNRLRSPRWRKTSPASSSRIRRRIPRRACSSFTVATARRRGGWRGTRTVALGQQVSYR